MLYAEVTVEMSTDDLSTAPESSVTADTGMIDDLCYPQSTETVPSDAPGCDFALVEVKEEFPERTDVNDEWYVDVKEEMENQLDECGSAAVSVRLCLCTAFLCLHVYCES